MAKPEDFVGMMPDFPKPAGLHCQHQRHDGCNIYDRRPFGCRYWNCRWLTGVDTRDLSRPDRAGYVIDIIPDFVSLDPGDGNRTNVEVVQIWVDQKRPNAWEQDKALRAYLERRGREGIAAIIRSGAKDARVLFPPAMASDGQWHEVNQSQMQIKRERSGEERFAGVAQAKNVTLQIPEESELIEGGEDGDIQRHRSQGADQV